MGAGAAWRGALGLAPALSLAVAAAAAGQAPDGADASVRRDCEALAEALREVDRHLATATPPWRVTPAMRASVAGLAGNRCDPSDLVDVVDGLATYCGVPFRNGTRDVLVFMRGGLVSSFGWSDREAVVSLPSLSTTKGEEDPCALV